MITVDGDTPSFQPTKAPWSPRAALGMSGTGAPVYSSKREVTLTFPRLTFAQLAEWLAFCDGQPHDVNIPDEAGVQTAYTNVFLERTGGEQRAGAWYDVTIRIFRIFAP